MVSDPIDLPSTKNSTDRIPAGALASAATITRPFTVGPVGAVSTTLGPAAAPAAVLPEVEATTPVSSRAAIPDTNRGRERERELR